MSIRSFLLGVTGVVLVPVCAVAFDYAVDTVIFEGAAGTTKIKITASTRPFVRAAHKTTELRNAGTEENEDWQSATVDGKKVVGTDQTLPKDGLPQLSSLIIWFGNSKISVPVEHLNHVFLPHMRPASIQKGYAETLVTISADSKAVHLSLDVGDGGGSGTYDLLISADGTVSTLPVRRPEP